MVYPLELANNILKRSFEENIPLTNMQLQKIIYLLYKDYLKKTDKCLFAEDFQVWETGAVLSNVYEYFKEYGSSAIKSYYIESINCTPNTILINEDANENLKNSLNYIWNKYKYFSGHELTNLMIFEGSAWDKAVKSGENFLCSEHIKNEPESILFQGKEKLNKIFERIYKIKEKSKIKKEITDKAIAR